MKIYLKVILEVLFTYLLFFNIFVSKMLDTTYTLILLIVFLILSFIIFGYRSPNRRNSNDAMYIVGGLAFVLIGGFYLIGFKEGFSVNYSTIFKHYITTFTWVKVFLIVILSELLRYIIILDRERTKDENIIVQGIMFIIMLLLDVTIASKVFDLTSFNQIYEFFALIFVQSISKNLLMNYVSKRFGYKPCILYRFIMDLYIYFLPIIPRINVFIEAVILLIYPYVIYSLLNKIYGVAKIEPARQKKDNAFVTAILTIIFGILVMLVSREFQYAMIAVGSESMTGTINKGDAIIYQRIADYKPDLKKGDIIVFQKNGVLILHRIVDIYPVGDENVYRTKGDYNTSVDNWVVTQDELVGIVKGRVILIAWPSVLLNEMF